MTRSPTTILLLAIFTITGCAQIDRLKNVGEGPEVTTIENPANSDSYHPVTMPMPPPAPSLHTPNSLWRTGARSFFRDQRAARVGDILTVLIQIQDDAVVNNSTSRTRDAEEAADVTNIFGYEGALDKVLPEAINPGSLVAAGSASNHTGTGSVNRKETVNLTVAAMVTQILPNGNMVIQGHQEVRVNYEVRDLDIAGVIRPEDISASNTIQHTQVAEARVSYGGRGEIQEMQRSRYGQQIVDVILPF
jgi:flagellar L-ring protein FlgH